LPKKTKAIAPIHVDDLAELCAYLVTTIRAQGRDIDAVGTAELSIADYIATLRASMGHGAAMQLRLPNGLFLLAAKLSVSLGSKTFCPEVIDLMQHAHVGAPGAITHWLHKRPIPARAFQTKATEQLDVTAIVAKKVSLTH
jgi:hypothetical protein